MMRLTIFFTLLVRALSQEEPSTTPSDMPSLTMFPTSTPTLDPTLSPTVTGGSQALEPICGDCWCVPEGDAECPDEQPGFNGNFPPFISDLYATFVLTSDPIVLTPPEGSSSCYPFQDLLDLERPYPESEFPQCVKPPTDGYCAYVFEDGNQVAGISECAGRRYSMETFASEEDVPSNAVITHKNACGVCSSAQDLEVRMRTRNTLEQAGVVCGSRYFLTSDEDRFADLAACWEGQGFTPDCALLWAHYTATNGALCAGKCIGHVPPFNGPAPQCEVTECIKCGDPFAVDFDALAGRDQPRSGITESIGRPCSEFYPVIHDPCPGQTAPPTATPAPTASGAITTTGNIKLMSLVMMMVGLRM